MSRRKVDYVYVPKKKIKKVVIDAKKGRKSIEKTVNQRQILDGAYVRASAMKEFPNGKFAQGGEVKIPIKIKNKLEAIRKSIQNENVSYEELYELQSLSKYIDPSDVN